MAIGTVFINNRTQAVRLPLEVRLPEGVLKVEIRVREMSASLRRLDRSGTAFSERPRCQR